MYRKARATLVITIAALSLGIVLSAYASNISANSNIAEAIALGQAVPGQLIVQFKKGSSMIEAKTLTDDSDGIGAFSLVDVPASSKIDELADQLRKQPGVSYVGPNILYRASLIPTDPSFGDQWALRNTGQSVLGSTGTSDSDIDATEAWDTETGSASVVVAVVDSGVQWDHAEFIGNIWENTGEVSGGTCPANGDTDGNGLVDDCYGYDFVTYNSVFTGSGTNAPHDNDPSPCSSSIAAADTADCNGIDDNGDGAADNFTTHGTHVAGIIAALQNNATGAAGISGIAPGVSLMPVRALTEDGIGTTSDVLSAMNYAIDEGADIINMSFGSDIFDPAFDAVVRSAIAADVVLVAASGNDNENIVTGSDCDSPVCNDDPDDTGANGVVGVSATDNKDRKASYSNYSTENWIDVSAPGSIIMSTCYDSGKESSSGCLGVEPDKEYSYMSGTSMAAPHATGVAALIKSAFPALSAKEIVTVLKYGGDNITSKNAALAGCGGADCTTGLSGLIGQSRINADGIFEPRIVSVSPSTVTVGQSANISITGINTAFGGSSSAAFGTGIDVVSTSCSSSVTCTANINVTDAASLGTHDVSVTTGATTVTLADGLSVSGSMIRISGPNRIGTAIEISKNAYPGIESADAVLVARSDAFPDSLAGAPLSGLANGPILFTQSDSLDSFVKAEIIRVLNRTVDADPDIYVLGGVAAISAAVESELASLNPDWSVKRIGGANRSETSVLIADELHGLRGGAPDAIFVARQDTFPDALAAAVPASDGAIDPKRMPILLTPRDVLSDPVRAYVTAHGSSISSSFLAGGTVALGSAVEADIGTLTGSAIRLAGADRYVTAATISEHFYKTPLSVSVASGLNFPDALAGSYHAGGRSSPMLLTKGDVTPQATIDYMNGHSATLIGGYAYGGTVVISDGVLNLLGSLI